jgi:signal transduction histidine kinase
MQLQKSKKRQGKTIKELQQQLEDLKAENLLLKDQLTHKEQFTAMIAHDLRGPLAPIINYAQMLARQVSGQADNEQQVAKKNAALRRNTSIIVSQAKRMSRLVNDLLDTSHLSAGTFTLLREECDIVEIVREMLEQLRPVAPYHTLVVAAPTQPLKGNWDAGRLQQAIGNLLDNAIKYSDENTTITVTIAQIEKSAHISIHNQGTSIPPKNISQLFHPYTRLPEARTRPGSGLGLFITKSIIEAHGGTLRLEPSTEDTGGTTFTFDLPLSEN